MIFQSHHSNRNVRSYQKQRQVLVLLQLGPAINGKTFVSLLYFIYILEKILDSRYKDFIDFSLDAIFNCTKPGNYGLICFKNFCVSISLFCYYLIRSLAKTGSVNMAITMSASKLFNLCCSRF